MTRMASGFRLRSRRLKLSGPNEYGRRRIRTAAEAIARTLEAAGMDVLLDDRDERSGVKFKVRIW